MPAAKYAFEIDTGNNVIRGALTGAEDCYRESSDRAHVQFSTITHPDFGQFQSRQDERTLYQATWSGGAEWEGPLFKPQFEHSYTYGRNMDGSLSPGRLLPSNGITAGFDGQTPC